MEGQELDEVLARFSKKRTQAVASYRKFIADGIASGHREDLIGGGLKRSLFGREACAERTAYDERILGSGEFVEVLTGGNKLQESERLPLSLAELLHKVCEVTGVNEDALQRSTRERTVARTRAIFCWLAVHECGYTGKEAGTAAGLGSSGVAIAIRRGGDLLRNEPTLRERFVGGVS